jgi:guanylate kinase
MFKTKKFIVVVTAPSGAGKTTVISRLIGRSESYRYSVSATTRPARDGEVHGKDYLFLGRQEFDTGVADGDFAEWAEVHGNSYGTLKSQIDSILAGGQYVLMDVDIQGARHLRESYPDGVYIHLIPPSMEELRRRLSGRGTEDEQALHKRLQNAIGEIEEMDKFDYLVVNESIEEACDRIEGIINAESLKVSRLNDAARLIDTFLGRGSGD